MKRSSAKRSSLFLLELIIAILFFSLASAVCIQVFTRAHMTGLQNDQLNRAINEATSAAEAFLASDGTPGGVAALLEGAQTQDEHVYTFFGSDWQPTDQDNASFILLMAIDGEGPLLNGKIVVTPAEQESKTLYGLELQKYLPPTIQ